MAEKKEAANKSAKKIKITLIKSTNGCTEKQRATVQALGLTKIRTFKIHNDNDAIKGMLDIVGHMVKVEAAE